MRRRVARLVDLIARGRESTAVAEELAVPERRVEVLEAEVEAMRWARSVELCPPSLGWLEKRLAAFRTLLERRTAESAMLLRRLLGKIPAGGHWLSLPRPFWDRANPSHCRG